MFERGLYANAILALLLGLIFLF